VPRMPGEQHSKDCELLHARFQRGRLVAPVIENDGNF
jgi:hypothetical protein